MSGKNKSEKPSEVKVLWAKYDILFGENIRSEDDTKCFGVHDYSKMLIGIDNRFDHNQESVCLLHEILHAIEYLQGFDIDEDIIRGLSHGLKTVMKENPKIRDFIFGDK